MYTLIKVILPYTIGIIISLIALIVIIIFHKKCWIVWSVVLTILIVLAIYVSFPYYKDIKNKEVSEIEGVLIRTSTLGKAPLFSTALVVEQEDGSTIEIILPSIDYKDYNLEFDKHYRILFYNNSQVLHSIELIEQI